MITLIRTSFKHRNTENYQFTFEKYHWYNQYDFHTIEIVAWNIELKPKFK